MDQIFCQTMIKYVKITLIKFIEISHEYNSLTSFAARKYSLNPLGCPFLIHFVTFKEKTFLPYNVIKQVVLKSPTKLCLIFTAALFFSVAIASNHALINIPKIDDQIVELRENYIPPERSFDVTPPTFDMDVDFDIIPGESKPDKLAGILKTVYKILKMLSKNNFHFLFPKSLAKSYLKRQNAWRIEPHHLIKEQVLLRMLF